jgi:hypothetical protein
LRDLEDEDRVWVSLRIERDASGDEHRGTPFVQARNEGQTGMAVS